MILLFRSGRRIRKCSCEIPASPETTPRTKNQTQWTPSLAHSDFACTKYHSLWSPLSLVTVQTEGLSFPQKKVGLVLLLKFKHVPRHTDIHKITTVLTNPRSTPPTVKKQLHGFNVILTKCINFHLLQLNSCSCHDFFLLVTLTTDFKRHPQPVRIPNGATTNKSSSDEHA